MKIGAYACPSCGAVSMNPNDARERYCGRCHRFAGDEEERAMIEAQGALPVMSEANDNRPEAWDRSAYEVARLVRDALAAVPGCEVTGSGASADGSADVSIRRGGEEFWITVRRMEGKA